MRELKIIAKTLGYMALAMGAYFVISLAWAFLTKALMSTNVLPDFIASIPVSIILIGLLMFLPKRWLRYPRELTFQHAHFIEAPAKTVWDAIYPAPREKHYQAVIDRITTVTDTSEPNYRYHFIPALAQEGAPQYYDVEIAISKPRSRLRLNPVSTEYLPLFAKTSRGSEWDLIEQDGGTWVRLTEHQDKPSILSIVLLWLIKPHRDDLKQLAAFCEGRENTSWMGRETRALNSAHMRPAGELPTLRQSSDAMLIIGTVMVASTLLCGGLVYWALSMST